MNNPCSIPGCVDLDPPTRLQPFCTKHWEAAPRQLRQRLWTYFETEAKTQNAGYHATVAEIVATLQGGALVIAAVAAPLPALEVAPAMKHHRRVSSTSHHCHARDCAAEVPRAQLFCGGHWKLLADPLKKLVAQHCPAGVELSLLGKEALDRVVALLGEVEGRKMGVSHLAALRRHRAGMTCEEAVQQALGVPGPELGATGQPVKEVFGVNPQVGAGILFLTPEGEVLLLQRAASKALWPGLWDQPGGRVQPGETPRACAIREAQEETGWAGQSRPEGLYLAPDEPFYSRAPGPETPADYSCFLVGTERFPVKLRPEEHSGRKWVPLAEAVELENLCPGTRLDLQALVKHLDALASGGVTYRPEDPRPSEVEVKAERLMQGLGGTFQAPAPVEPLPELTAPVYQPPKKRKLKRASDRAEAGARDLYVTPQPWARAIAAQARRLAPTRLAHVIEPSAGPGVLVGELALAFPVEVGLLAIEVDHSHNLALADATRLGGRRGTGIWHERWQEAAPKLSKFHTPDTNLLIVGNPPYSEWEEHVAAAWAAMQLGDGLLFLLGSNVLGGQERAKYFWPAFPAKYLIPLAGRPSFEAGETGKYDYSLFYWEKGYVGPLTVLPHLWKGA